MSAPPVGKPLGYRRYTGKWAKISVSASPCMSSYIVTQKRQILKGRKDHHWTATNLGFLNYRVITQC